MPRRQVAIESFSAEFGEREMDRAREVTGVGFVRIADESTTASDLCLAAAIELLRVRELGPADVDALVFVSSTPDHLLPPTSHLLQHKLGLARTVPCFDLVSACTGYVYGLFLSSLLLHAGSAKRVLLLAGDTTSKCLDPKDRSTRALLGDAGSATLLTAEPWGPSTFSIHSDGAGGGHIMLPGSGFRGPAEAGHLVMKGLDVFAFAVREVPGSVTELMARAGVTAEEVGCFAFHQASKIIVESLARKLRLPPEKLPWSLAAFGNTGIASIPLSLVTDAQAPGLLRGRSVFCGYGSGLSWASALLDTRGVLLAPLVEIGHAGPA